MYNITFVFFSCINNLRYKLYLIFVGKKFPLPPPNRLNSIQKEAPVQMRVAVKTM